MILTVFPMGIIPYEVCNDVLRHIIPFGNDVLRHIIPYEIDIIKIINNINF